MSVTQPSEVSSIAERAAQAPRVAPDAQDGLFDQVIENDILERALEKRQEKKEIQSKAAKDYKEANSAAKGIFESLDVEPDTTIRVGRFRLKFSSVQARHVSFDTEPTNRLSISVVKDD